VFSFIVALTVWFDGTLDGLVCRQWICQSYCLMVTIIVLVWA